MTSSFALFCIIVGIGAANADMNTTQCNACLEDDFDLCVNNTEIQNCTTPATDSCFSAAGRYMFDNGSTVVLAGVARGCVPCPNIAEGCAAFKMFFDQITDWTLQDCNIICCKGDLCNNQTVSLAPTTTPATDGATTSEEPTTASHPSHCSPTAAVLAIATIIGVFFF